MSQVRFYIESSLDGRVWQRLGSSSFLWSWAGAYVMYDGLFDTPLGRGEERVFRMGVCPIWADLRIQTHLLAVTMFACFNVAVRTKRQMLGRCACVAVRAGTLGRHRRSRRRGSEKRTPLYVLPSRSRMDSQSVRYGQARPAAARRAHLCSCPAPPVPCGSTIAVWIWGVITVIGVTIVLRSLRAGQYEMAYIAALFALNDGGSVLWPHPAPPPPSLFSP